MKGAGKEITAYYIEGFISGKVEWTEIVVPGDRPLITENLNKQN